MEKDQERALGSALEAQLPPALISLSPFSHPVSPSPRRLSSHFAQPNRPVPAARQLAWVSLQGRLVGADEASLAKTIGGGLSPEEAVAWDLFSPIHRVLIVAVIAVAAAHTKKNKQIYQLQKSVELRDQVLLSMQQKLDNLCEQLNYIKDQPGTLGVIASEGNTKFMSDESFASEHVVSIGCGCQFCDQHKSPLNNTKENSMVRVSGDEMFKYKLSLSHMAEPEERRMSDLSDWAPSVSSSIDIQLSTLAIEQDVYNLKKECAEKDATIQELSMVLHSSEAVGSKRIADLEDIIRRKNTRMSKLKKDIVILEQKVMQLTRMQRPSSASSLNKTHLPLMADNLLYDMDSTTSPSSSDSECPTRNQPQSPVFKGQDPLVQNSNITSRQKERLAQTKSFDSLLKPVDRLQNSQPVSPLKEKSMNQLLHPGSSLRSMQSLSAGGDVKNPRRSQTRSKAVSLHKRWV
ncbi:hypothetical protein NMG60_11017111 [Bertholletia excelsa]